MVVIFGLSNYIDVVVIFGLSNYIDVVGYIMTIYNIDCCSCCDNNESSHSLQYVFAVFVW